MDQDGKKNNYKIYYLFGYFWKDAQLLITIYAPLFILLRIVDVDKRGLP